MYQVDIEKIDIRISPQIKGIYACYGNEKWYIGKSNDIFRRLNYHKSSSRKGYKFYILESYKDISKLDLMIMEDFYICKWEALGLNLENVNDAIPPRIREFLRGGKKWIKLYKQFENCGMSSNIYKLKIKQCKTQRRVYAE